MWKWEALGPFEVQLLPTSEIVSVPLPRSSDLLWAAGERVLGRLGYRVALNL